jgi:hypothetical protein
VKKRGERGEHSSFLPFLFRISFFRNACL